MTSEFTSLSLKCLLEYMEPNKRIAISTRAPSIQRLEKSTPLHLDTLKFHDQAIQINEFHYTMIPCLAGKVERVSRRGDINLDTKEEIATNGDKRKHPEENFVNGIGFEMGRTVLRTLEKPLSYQKVMKTLTTVMFEGRKNISVKKLKVKVVNRNILHLPIGFRVDVLHQMDTGVNNTRACVHLLKYPYKFTQHKLTISDRPLVHIYNADSVKMFDGTGQLLRVDELVHVSSISKLYYDSPHVSRTFLLDLAWDWIDNKAGIGKCYVFRCDSRKTLIQLIWHMRKNVASRVVELKEPDPRALLITHKLAIPINKDSELVIYGYADPLKSKRPIHFKMEVMKTGSTTINNSTISRIFKVFGDYYGLKFDDHCREIKQYFKNCYGYLLSRLKHLS